MEASKQEEATNPATASNPVTATNQENTSNLPDGNMTVSNLKESNSMAHLKSNGDLKLDFTEFDINQSNSNYLDNIEKAYNHLMTNLHLEELSRMHARKIFGCNSQFS